MFLSAKKTILRTALDRTVTRAKKAEDDYDYPEDLSTVVLNRPKAVLAKSLPDPETRLSYSVFGQAFDELHFLEPSALRMAYTHPMDDGKYCGSIQQKTVDCDFGIFEILFSFYLLGSCFTGCLNDSFSCSKTFLTFFIFFIDRLYIIILILPSSCNIYVFLLLFFSAIY